MKFIIIVRFVLFFLLLIFNNSQAFSHGSYLFCINKSVKKEYLTIEGLGWNWAKGEDKTNILDEYKNILVVYDNNGVWINGFGVLPSYARGHILSVHHNFENKKEAKKFCSTLIKKCQADFGSDFSLLGVSSWDIPNWTWGTISVKYGMIGWSHCDNWERFFAY